MGENKNKTLNDCSFERSFFYINHYISFRKGTNNFFYEQESYQLCNSHILFELMYIT
jgi:hypothetical protein